MVFFVDYPKRKNKKRTATRRSFRNNIIKGSGNKHMYMLFDNHKNLIFRQRAVHIINTHIIMNYRNILTR